MKTPLIVLAACAALSSCSGVLSGITGQPVASTPVQRIGGTPVNVATADLLQAEAGAPDKVHGLYDVGLVAVAVGKVSASSK